MDCPPKKNGCCREVAISGVSAVVMNLLFHSPVTFDQISNSFLVIVLQENTSLWQCGQRIKQFIYCQRHVIGFNSLLYSGLLIFCVVVEPKKIQVNSQKTQNTANWTDQFLVKFAPKITTESAVFYRLFFSEVCAKKSGEISRFFHKFVHKSAAKFDFFPMTYQKPCLFVFHFCYMLSLGHSCSATLKS